MRKGQSWRRCIGYLNSNPTWTRFLVCWNIPSQARRMSNCEFLARSTTPGRSLLSFIIDVSDTRMGQHRHQIMLTRQNPIHLQHLEHLVSARAYLSVGRIWLLMGWHVLARSLYLTVGLYHLRHRVGCIWAFSLFSFCRLLLLLIISPPLEILNLDGIRT